MCLLGNLILLSSMAVDLGPGQDSPQRSGEGLHITRQIEGDVCHCPGTQTELNCRTARGQTELSEFR